MKEKIGSSVIDAIDEITYVTSSMDYLEDVVDHRLSSIIRIMRDRLEIVTENLKGTIPQKM